MENGKNKETESYNKAKCTWIKSKFSEHEKVKKNIEKRILPS